MLVRDKTRSMDGLGTLFDRYRKHGDVEALGRVFDRLAPRLLSVALHLCGDPADAEDVVQQTFLLAMDRAESFDATRRLEPWFAGLLHNAARNATRRASRRRAGPLPELAGRDEGPLEAAERSELVTRLGRPPRSAESGLKPKQSKARVSRRRTENEGPTP